MKHLPLLFIALVLVSCQTKRKVTITAEGKSASYEDNGHLGGDTLVMLTPDGRVILRNKMTESFQDGVQAVQNTALGATGLVQAGLTSRARDAADAAVATGAQNSEVAKAGLDAGVKTAEINAGVETTRILNPP